MQSRVLFTYMCGFAFAFVFAAGYKEIEEIASRYGGYKRRKCVRKLSYKPFKSRYKSLSRPISEEEVL